MNCHLLFKWDEKVNNFIKIFCTWLVNLLKLSQKLFCIFFVTSFSVGLAEGCLVSHYFFTWWILEVRRREMEKLSNKE